MLGIVQALNSLLTSIATLTSTTVSASGPATNVHSNALEKSNIISGAPCTLRSVKVLNTTGADYYLMLFDPNDAGFADALRGWYLDIRGQLIALDSTVHTAGTFSAALQTQHLVDLSGSAVTATLPAASDANAGTEIVVSQVVAGAGTLNLTPASGKVENASTLALTGSSSAPFLSVRLMSCGTAASGFGWKIV